MKKMILAILMTSPIFCFASENIEFKLILDDHIVYIMPEQCPLFAMDNPDHYKTESDKMFIFQTLKEFQEKKTNSLTWMMTNTMKDYLLNVSGCSQN